MNCSLGTYSSAYPHSKRLFSSVIKAAESKSDFQFIVQLGDHFGDDEFKNCPDNVILVQQSPQLEILKKARIFITHGGFSSTREGAYFGVPMIVFPCWLDQPGNAARVVAHDLGVKGDINKVTPDILNSLMEEILNSNTMAAASADMKKSFRNHQDCNSGVKAITSFIENS